MFEIIPAIDVIDWKVVRLSQWDYSKATFYEKSVVEMVQYFEEKWIKYLHLVDLIWAKKWKIQEISLVKKILEKTSLKIDFGWWIRDKSDIYPLLASPQGRGIKYINIWSLAIENKKLMTEFIEEFWAENFSIGIDVIWDYCYTNWWQKKSDLTYKEILSFYSKLWVKRFNITSIENDWMLCWLDIKLYKKIIQDFPNLEIIASGWVRNNKDILQAKEIWCAGVIVGKALYEGGIEINQKNYDNQKNYTLPWCKKLKSGKMSKI